MSDPTSPSSPIVWSAGVLHRRGCADVSSSEEIAAVPDEALARAKKCRQCGPGVAAAAAIGGACLRCQAKRGTAHPMFGRAR